MSDVEDVHARIETLKEERAYLADQIPKLDDRADRLLARAEREAVEAELEELRDPDWV